MRDFNALLARRMPLIAPASLLCGLALGDVLTPWAWLVPWLFAVMTFSAGLGLQWTAFRKVLARPGFLLASLSILHLLVPLCAWLAASLFYDDPRIITGLMIISLAPVGSTSMVWVAYYKGNVSLALSVIIADTLVAPFLIPVMLHLFVGADVVMNSTGIMLSLFWMILFPSLLAGALNAATRGRAGQKLGQPMALAAKLGIMAVLLLNGGIAASHLKEMSWGIAGLLVFVFCLCCFGYALSFVLGRVLLHEKADVLAFMLSGGLRNVGSGVALSTLYFSPLTSLTVVTGMLFQQILGYNAGLLASRALNSSQT